MKFAFAMPHILELKATMQPWELGVTGADQTLMAKRAEELGYDMIAVPEHHIIPREHVELSGAHYFHAAAAQGYLAGATSKILINSCISILPLQHPVVTAKALATIDWLSSGRIIATFGVGWLKGEFDLLGVPFNKRGAMAEEYLAAMVELWTKENPEFEGEFVSFRDVAFEPKPFRKPHVAIWMGGDADAPLKRVARYASGWWPFLTKPEDIPARIDFIKSQPEYDGRPLEIMYGISTSRVGEGHVVQESDIARPGQSAQQLVDILNHFHELGITMSSVPIPQVSCVDEYMEYCQWVVEEIKPKVP